MLEKLLEIDQVTLDFSDESKLLLNITIGFIMFGVALELKFDDFKKLFDNPKSVIIGIISQFLLMPLLTFVLALTLKSYITPTVGLGMILVASCPGGNVSNFISSLARGNVALSVSLTAFSSFAGEKYTAIGTSQGLFLYYGNDFFDITPLDTAITGCTLTTVNASRTVTVNKGSHGLAVGRYVTLSSVTVTGASDFTAAELEQVYEILTVPDVDKFTVQASRAEGGTGMTAAGAATVNPYVEVGPTTQTTGFGWSTATWGASTWGTARATSSVV